MKSRHEKIIKRKDGSRVRIIVDLIDFSYGNPTYRAIIHICEKRKRTWRSTFDSNCYAYRELSMEERRKHEHESQLKFISEDELLQAKLELWETLKPA